MLFRSRGEKRVRWIDGSFEEHRKYVKCWNCGFIVDTTRDLGDPYVDGRYQVPLDYIVPETFGGSDIRQITGTARMGMRMVISETEPFVIPVSYIPMKAQVSKGCPCCGCANLI